MGVILSFGGISYDPPKKKTNRKKGKSLNDFPSSYCVLDLETTGLSTAYDEIIEVGILKVKDNQVVDQYESLVQPHYTYLDDDDNVYYVNDFITELTGITNEMLETAPKFDIISQEISEFIGDNIIVGHNVHFDINFLYDSLIKNEHVLDNDLWDLLKISRRVLKDLEHHRLKDLAEFFDYSYEPHRAIADCVATNDLKLLLEKHIDDEGIDYDEITKSYNKHYTLDLTALKATVEEIDVENPFYKQNVCFTGKLTNFSRKEAAQILVNLGANNQNNLTKKTNFLVQGSFNGVNIKGEKSGKAKKAESYILQGQDIKIIDEDTFLEMLEFN